MLTKYTSLIDSLLAIDDNIALSAGDQQLATNVRALGLVSRIAGGDLRAARAAGGRLLAERVRAAAC